jgi:hypothetical protein
MLEGQPKASNLFIANLFTYEGYEAENRRHTGPEKNGAHEQKEDCQTEDDPWNIQGHAATWFITPGAPHTVSTVKPKASSTTSKTAGSRGRIAALIGAVMMMTAPLNDQCTSISINQPFKHNFPGEASDHCCGNSKPTMHEESNHRAGLNTKECNPVYAEETSS